MCVTGTDHHVQVSVCVSLLAVAPVDVSTQLRKLMLKEL